MNARKGIKNEHSVCRLPLHSFIYLRTHNQTYKGVSDGEQGKGSPSWGRIYFARRFRAGQLVLSFRVREAIGIVLLPSMRAGREPKIHGQSAIAVWENIVWKKPGKNRKENGANNEKKQRKMEVYVMNVNNRKVGGPLHLQGYRSG